MECNLWLRIPHRLYYEDQRLWMWRNTRFTNQGSQPTKIRALSKYNIYILKRSALVQNKIYPLIVGDQLVALSALVDADQRLTCDKADEIALIQKEMDGQIYAKKARNLNFGY